MSGRDRLGKGLGALLGDYLEPVADPGEVRRLALGSIVPNPLQPRRVFTDSELSDLTASINENGLLQPLVVRPAPGTTDRYELIAGERRLRSVRRLGWAEVPVLVREASDETLLVLALVENLQREALNALEEAEGYVALGETFGLSQVEIAEAVGKDRSTVSNVIRLLKLPVSVRKFLEDGSLSAGHARALLAVDDPVRAGTLAQQAVKEGWSVREIERKVAGPKEKTRKRTPEVDPVVRELEDALQAHLGTRVTIRPKRGGNGSIQIDYHDAEDFERLFELVTGRNLPGVMEG